MFRTQFASIIRSIIKCSSSHWCLSWVRDRINPVYESMAVCTMLFHGSVGLKAWWCALCVSGGERVAMYSVVVPASDWDIFGVLVHLL